MSLISKETTTYLVGSCSADDAETLLTWLLANPQGALDLKTCTHLHTAVLQVLMVCRPAIRVRPNNKILLALLSAAGM